MSDVMFPRHAEKGNSDEAAARGLVEFMMMKMLRLMGPRRPGVSSLYAGDHLLERALVSQLIHFESSEACIAASAAGIVAADVRRGSYPRGYFANLLERSIDALRRP
jgi:hypothetical protein